jgi:hypothetical protein
VRYVVGDEYCRVGSKAVFVMRCVGAAYVVNAVQRMLFTAYVVRVISCVALLRLQRVQWCAVRGAQCAYAQCTPTTMYHA